MKKTCIILLVVFSCLDLGSSWLLFRLFPGQVFEADPAVSLVIDHYGRDLALLGWMVLAAALLPILLALFWEYRPIRVVAVAALLVKIYAVANNTLLFYDLWQLNTLYPG